MANQEIELLNTGVFEDTDGNLYRKLENGEAIFFVPQIYNWLLAIGPLHSDTYRDSWEYTVREPAIAAFVDWNGEGEPEGWYRHPSSGRRRPDGDPAKEFIRK